uniref:Integrin subunit alpha E n=1 Tax=Varanus komodoensis TaxID=61221 RepID=A0A8D2L8U2_VARKO
MWIHSEKVCLGMGGELPLLRKLLWWPWLVTEALKRTWPKKQSPSMPVSHRITIARARVNAAILQIKSFRSAPNLLVLSPTLLSADFQTEIAIILDGSGSIDPPDFELAKNFIYNMMETFYEKCLECVFALVQYGYIIQTEFDLQVDKASALRKVRAVKQVGNVTRTASAMQHVLDSIFSASHGSQKKSDKIILVLTDGEILMDELDLKTVISSSEMAGIERYAIGVGEAFNRMNPLQELRLIASDPDESHLFRVTNYSALNVLLSTLEQKFFQIEGMAGNILEFELAESGFSVHFPDEKNILFGAVGAFDWSGGVLLHNPAKGSTVFLNESKEATDARNGYLVNTGSDTLMVAGAPRRGMTGRVLVFEDVHLKQSLNGTQVGSYYGSEFCLLDINQDGITDYLLVGAPFFHVHGEEGKVYLYHFDKEVKVSYNLETLSGDPSFPFARFGFAMAAIGDIDANGFGDVAIGAPLEGHEPDSGSSGSIYIFNGGKDGIHSSFSQRITAAQTGVAGLMYFGRSVAGGLDFTEDGLLDLVVGSLGNVILLRFCFSLPHPDSFQPCTDDCFSNITLRLSYRLHASETDLSYPSAMLDFYQVSEVYFQVRSETRPPCPSCLETACLLHLKQQVSHLSLAPTTLSSISPLPPPHIWGFCSETGAPPFFSALFSPGRGAGYIREEKNSVVAGPSSLLFCDGRNFGRCSFLHRTGGGHGASQILSPSLTQA